MPAGETSNSGVGWSRSVPIGLKGSIVAVGAALAATLVYLNALHNPFIYDDVRTIVENSSILNLGDWRTVLRYDPTRPVVNLSFALDYRIWGPGPFGFHLTNVLLHALNVVLLFHVAWRVSADSRDRPSLAAASAATASLPVHPVMTEAVGYVSSRSDVLVTTWMLASLLTLRRWFLSGGAWWWMASLAFWAAGLATKELAAMFPILAFAYDRLLLRSATADLKVGGSSFETADTTSARYATRRRVLRWHLPILGLAFVAVTARLAIFALVEYNGLLHIRWLTILDELEVARRSFALVLIPAGQTIFHAVRPIEHLSDVRVVAGIAVVGALMAAIYALRNRAPVSSFGIFWFLVFLVPSAILLLNRSQGLAEHRLYLASAGLLLAAGDAYGRLVSRLRVVHPRVHWLAAGLLAVVLLSLSTRTVVRNMMWSSPVTLWAEAVHRAPNHPLPRTVLGESLHAAGHHEEAAAEFRAALDAGVDDELVYTKLALCLSELGRFPEATSAIETLRNRSPQSATVPLGLGIVAVMAGKPGEASAQFREAIARNPGDFVARQWLAVIAEQVDGDAAGSLKLCEEIQQIIPGHRSNEDCLRRNRERLATPAGRP